MYNFIHIPPKFLKILTSQEINLHKKMDLYFRKCAQHNRLKSIWHQNRVIHK